MELTEHEVRFDIWCPRCRHGEAAEDDTPCDMCLQEAVALYSRKPLYYKAKEEYIDYILEDNEYD